VESGAKRWRQQPLTPSAAAENRPAQFPLKAMCRSDSIAFTHENVRSAQFELPAQVNAELYRKRWQVELFFKWIKQHLRIHGFYGRSPNAMRCQIWSAICAYLLVAIAKKQIGIRKTLYDILQIVSVNIFEQVPLQELLANDAESSTERSTDEQMQKYFVFNE
jgi:hypothetical protein